MTEDQFNTLIAGAERASKEELHRLAGLLNAVAGVAHEPSEENVAYLVEWAVKVAFDITRSR